MKLFSAIFFLFVAFSNGIIAQNQTGCGLAPVLEKMINEHPDLIAKMDQFQQMQHQYIAHAKASSLHTADTSFIIPIVFHVVHNYGSENISDAQIMNELDTLNRDYNKLNRDTIQVVAPFNKLIANLHIEWRLAQIDPNGKPTTGIDRIRSLATYNAGEPSKLNQWPNNKYLNVWIVNSISSGDGLSGGIILGYAPYPATVDGYYAYADGVLANNIAIGSIGTAGGPIAAPNVLSRTLTHELGHSLGLSHTWGSNNSPGLSCGDDGIADTPPTMGHTDCNNVLDGTCGADTLLNNFTFDNVTLTSGPKDTTSTYKLKTVSPLGDTLVKFSSLFAHGVSFSSSIAKEFSFTKWDTGGLSKGSINLDKYYEFQITPTSNYSLLLQTLSFSFHRNAKGIQNFALRSSLDNFASNLSGHSTNPVSLKVGAGNVFYVKSSAVTNTITFSVSLPSFIITPITIRVYGWDALDSTGYFGIKSVSSKISVGLTENVQNYMEYSQCQKMFTIDQGHAMHYTLTNAIANRNNLPTQANLIATGTQSPYNYNPNSVPVAEMHINTDSINHYDSTNLPVPNTMVVCQNNPVYFFNESWNSIKMDSVKWTFTNAVPSAASSIKGPYYNDPKGNFVKVQFNKSGWQKATLTVYADTGVGANKRVVMDTVSKLIMVNNPSAPAVVANNTGYSEGFESAEIPGFNANWMVNNVANNATKWAITNKAAYTGSNSIELNAYWTPTVYMPSDNNVNDIDELITPTMDLSTISRPLYLSFAYSYATRGTTPASVLDIFNIYYSSDCGENWAEVGSLTPNNDKTYKRNQLYYGASYSYSGDPLFANGGMDASAYTPTAGLWSLKKFRLDSLIDSLHSKNVRIKFKFLSSTNANNLYLDDINFSSSPLGINELTANNELTGFQLYPNPSFGSTTLTYHLSKEQKVNIDLYDIVGNKIQPLLNQKQDMGDFTLQIPTGELQTGVYFIRIFSNGQNVGVRKLVVFN